MEAVHKFIEENTQKKLGTVATELLQLITDLVSKSKATRTGTTFIRDASGSVVAINCYYFKRWMPLVGERAVEFGVSANSATGLNNMCKEGVANWTKQQRIAKQEQAALLDRVVSGEVSIEGIAAEKERIEAARKLVVATDLGFASEDEVRAYLTSAGVTL